MLAFEMNESKGLCFYKEFDITLRRANGEKWEWRDSLALLTQKAERLF